MSRVPFIHHTPHKPALRAAFPTAAHNQIKIVPSAIILRGFAYVKTMEIRRNRAEIAFDSPESRLTAKESGLTLPGSGLTMLGFDLTMRESLLTPVLHVGSCKWVYPLEFTRD